MALMSIKPHPVIEQAVETGVRYAITRLFKHRDENTISHDELRQHVEEFVHHITNELWAVIDFHDPEGQATRMTSL